MRIHANEHVQDVRSPAAARRLTLMRYALAVTLIACAATAWFGLAQVGSVHGYGTRIAPVPILAALVPLAIFAIASWRTGTTRMVKGLWITALVAAPFLIGAGIHRLDWRPHHRVEAYLIATITALFVAVLAGVIRAWPARQQQPIPIAIAKPNG